MEYTIVEEYSAELLSKLVNKKIAEGWKPIGGITLTLISADLCRYVFYQAMIREGKSIL